GHAEPWMIAMDCPPTRAAVLDYSVRWSIEPMFSDFKSRGFELENSQLRQADRLERLVLIMALAPCIGAFASGALRRRIARRPSKKNAGTSRI
ncbi:MAG: transposase, partial [Methylobacter sp.]